MLSFKMLRRSWRYAGFFISQILLISFSAGAFDRAELVSTPVVRYVGFDKEKQRVTYSVDFIFKKCPDNYFLYYDKNKNKLVIDFYSATIAWADSVLSNAFNGEFVMANVETPWSISGQKGQIMFSHQKDWRFYEEEWHYEIKKISKTTLQVKLWRGLRPAVKVKKQRMQAVDSIRKNGY